MGYNCLFLAVQLAAIAMIVTARAHRKDTIATHIICTHKKKLACVCTPTYAYTHSVRLQKYVLHAYHIRDIEGCRCRRVCGLLRHIHNNTHVLYLYMYNCKETYHQHNVSTIFRAGHELIMRSKVCIKTYWQIQESVPYLLYTYTC